MYSDQIEKFHEKMWLTECPIDDVKQKKYIKSDKQSMYQYAKNQHLYETTL